MLNRKQIFDAITNDGLIKADVNETQRIINRLMDLQNQNLKFVKTSGWNELSSIPPRIGQHILYEGNLCPAFGVYIGDDDVRLNDGTLDKFDRWQPK